MKYSIPKLHDLRGTAGACKDGSSATLNFTGGVECAPVGASASPITGCVTNGQSAADLCAFGTNADFLSGCANGDSFFDDACGSGSSPGT